MSQPPDPNPYGGQPQQPYGYPQQPPAHPQAGAYEPPAQPGGYPGVPQQPGYQQPYGQPPYGGGGYPQPGGPLPGMPPLASWGARVGATLLDTLIVMLVPMGLLIAGYAQFVAKLVDNQRDCDDAGLSTCPAPHMPGSALALIGIGLLLSLVAALYLCYREGKTGQTPGKKIVGIRVLREYDGSSLGFGLAFGRRLLHILDNLACYIGWLWPLWDSKNQTFADKCVHTVVIKDQQ